MTNTINKKCGKCGEEKDNALEKLFAMRNRKQTKFKTEEEYMKWVEEE
jgi:hypothetical protein